MRLADKPVPSVVTAVEHQVLAVGDAPGAIRHAEAERLATIAQSRPGFCALGYRSLRLAQYVGLVNLGGRVLEVLPKVGENADPAEGRGTLLRLLRLAHDLPPFEHGGVDHGLKRADLMEVFVLAYLRSLLQVVRLGLLRRYRSEEEDLNVLRGRLLIQRQATALAMRIDKLACRFDDLTVDNPWNQVLKAALLAVRPWVRGIDAGRIWLEMAAAFDEVSTCSNALALHSTLQLDRQAKHYGTSLRWAGWILRLLSPDIRAGSSQAPELLFDMNRLFEAATYAHLRKQVTREGLQLRAQHTGQHLATHRDNPGSKFFQLRPDLVLSDGSTVLAVADTKWARVGMDSVGRLVPQNDHAYQLNAYAGAYACGEVVLIYPWYDGLEGAHPSVYRLPDIKGSSSLLHVIGLDVSRDELPLKAVASESQLSRLLG